MNQKIKSLKIEDILCWDIEVIRGQESLLPDTQEYHLFEKKNRNRDTDEYLPEAELLELYKRKGGLDINQNKIVCISMAVVRNNKIYVRSITGEQKDIIEKFSDVLHKPCIPMGYNIIGFDFPTLRIKAFQEGIVKYAPDKFNDANKKPWGINEINYKINILDLMDVYRGTFFKNSTLEEACYSAGLPSPKCDIDGSQVSDVYYLEGVDRIAEYCQRDVVACIHLFQKMRGEDLIQDIVYVKREDGSPLESKKLTPIEALVNNQELTDELLESIKEKKPTKKELKIIRKLLIANMTPPKSVKKVKEEMIEVVDEFLSGL